MTKKINYIIENTIGIQLDIKSRKFMSFMHFLSEKPILAMNIIKNV